MKTNLVNIRRRQKTSGFSLVEIVVAVGIVATVMVALLGMIPTGLNTVNEAADTMAEIRIAQQLIGEVQMSAWDDLDQFKSKYFFDGDGNKLPTSEQSKARYTCQIQVAREALQLPSSEENEYAKQVTVKVSSVRGRAPNFADNAPKKEYRSFSTVVVMTDAVVDSRF